MSRIWISLAALLVAAGAMAQEPAVQAGTPALIEAYNGNTAGVFLQGLENGTLTFQPRKSTRTVSVSIPKVKKLTFFPKYDADAVEQQFNAGDYAAVLSTLISVMEPYEDYMVVENNLHDVYSMLIDVYLKTGNLFKAREGAQVLLESGDPVLVERGQIILALVALEENDLETAKKIRDEVTAEVAGLYLQACIERAENRPEDAIWTVAGIIKDHANDVEWLGHCELLCANLYLDMISTNSVITTNSALLTSRQVKNIYTGSSVSADATKLWTQLGGAEIEAAILAEKAEKERLEAEELEERRAKQKLEAEQKAKEEAEQKAKEEAEQKAKEEAAAAALLSEETGTNGTENVEMNTGTNVTTSTEMESD